MMGKEIDEENALIYDDDDEGFEESNILEEHTVAIMSFKIAAPSREWQQEKEVWIQPTPPPISLSASTFPVSWPPIFGEGQCLTPQHKDWLSPA